jgi:hypothetical protein
MKTAKSFLGIKEGLLVGKTSSEAATWQYSFECARFAPKPALFSLPRHGIRHRIFAATILLCLCFFCIKTAQAVVVLPALKLTLKIQSGNAIVSWPSGVTTSKVQIQSSASLSGPWQNVGAPTSGTSVTIPVSGPIGFYRGVISDNAVVPPAGTWMKRFGGSGNESGTAVALDTSGNILVAGYFQGAADFGGGLLTSAGGYDLVLAKYSPLGVHLWSKRFGGTGNEEVSSIALDPSGNIFLGGSFYGTANFGGATLTSAGDADAFLAKYSPQGDPIWSQRFGANFPDVINSIASDSQGNIIVTGFLQGILAIGGTTITSFGTGIDVFLAKFSPNGANLWVKNFYNAGTEYGNQVAVDKRNDDIVLIGYFNGYINFGGGQMDSSLLNTPGGYIAKFTPVGSHIWSRGYGGINGAATRFWSMALDLNGDIAVSGDFPMQTDLGGGTVTGRSWGTDLFVAKYSGIDGAYRWTIPILGYQASVARPTSMSVDSQNNIVMAGSFQGTYDFRTQSLTSSPGVSDGMIAKFSSAGASVWAQSFHSSGASSANAVEIDSSNHPVVTGYFTGSANLGGVSVTSAGGTDLILLRLNP